MMGAVLGAIPVACLIAPAFGAPETGTRIPQQTAQIASIGPFTPASPDPKLAALLAKSGIDIAAFRFTPSESRHTTSRAVTVAVRARTLRPVRDNEPSSVAATVEPSLGLAPIAYNLGVSVGWRRFALSGDVAKLDLGGAPGSRESVEAGISYAGKRISGRVTAAADRPLAGQPRLVSDPTSYSVDVGGSYALSRNLAVTAGVRYKAENYRLTEPSDTRRDSQAAYVGTIIRF